MNREQQKKEINKFLEKSYTGARMMNDDECMLRLARAITAFNADIDIDIFVSSYLPIPEN